MKKFIFLLLTFIGFTTLHSQILDPVKWTTKIERKSDTKFELTFDFIFNWKCVWKKA